MRTYKPRLQQISVIEKPRSASEKPVLNGVGDMETVFSSPYRSKALHDIRKL